MEDRVPLQDPCRDFSRFTSQLNDAACDALIRDGFAVVDQFFGHTWASVLLEEQRWLAARGLYEPNRTQFVTTSGAPKQFSKPNIYERDLHNQEVREKTRELAALWGCDELISALNAKIPELNLLLGTGARTVKLQWNKGGGGCFPLHYDNPGRPNKRRVTFLIYLNEDWEEEDGGELLLLPFCGRQVRVPPLMDRVVVFLSDRVLHRVLPSRRERFCLTIWIDAEGVNSDADVTLRLGGEALRDIPATASGLAASPVQRSLSRAVYEEEYEASLAECMAGAEGFEEMLASHRQFISGVRQNGGLSKLVEGLRVLRREREGRGPLTIE